MKRKLNRGIIGYERCAMISSGGEIKCAVCNRTLPFTRAEIESKKSAEWITNNGCLWCDTERK